MVEIDLPPIEGIVDTTIVLEERDRRAAHEPAPHHDRVILRLGAHSDNHTRLVTADRKMHGRYMRSIRHVDSEVQVMCFQMEGVAKYE